MTFEIIEIHKLLVYSAGDPFPVFLTQSFVLCSVVFAEVTEATGKLHIVGVDKLSRAHNPPDIRVVNADHLGAAETGPPLYGEGADPTADAQFDNQTWLEQTHLFKQVDQVGFHVTTGQGLLPDLTPQLSNRCHGHPPGPSP